MERSAIMLTVERGGRGKEEQKMPCIYLTELMAFGDIFTRQSSWLVGIYLPDRAHGLWGYIYLTELMACGDIFT